MMKIIPSTLLNNILMILQESGEISFSELQDKLITKWESFSKSPNKEAILLRAVTRITLDQYIAPRPNGQNTFTDILYKINDNGKLFYKKGGYPITIVSIDLSNNDATVLNMILSLIPEYASFNVKDILFQLELHIGFNKRQKLIDTNSSSRLTDFLLRQGFCQKVGANLNGMQIECTNEGRKLLLTSSYEEYVVNKDYEIEEENRKRDLEYAILKNHKKITDDQKWIPRLSLILSVIAILISIVIGAFNILKKTNREEIYLLPQHPLTQQRNDSVLSKNNTITK